MTKTINETHTYYCEGLKVRLTLPKGKHGWIINNGKPNEYGELTHSSIFRCD